MSMFKQLTYFIFYISIILTATSCQAEPEVTMPDKPLEIVLNTTAKALYESNPEYTAFQENDAQPMGVTFQGYNFPTSNMATTTFIYPNGQITLNNVVTVMGLDNLKDNDRSLEFLSISFFLRDESNNITDEKAYDQTMTLFDELENKGWVFNYSIGSPRLFKQDSFDFTIADHTSDLNLDFTYPLTFEEWMQLDDIHTWQLRHGTDVFMDIRYNRQTDPATNNRYYLMDLDILSEKELVQQMVDSVNRNSWDQYYPEEYKDLPLARLQSETQALEMGLNIQQDQPDYTLPLVLEKTGIDTSKFVSIDPYKITYEEFIKRQEAGEDMTPYYENQPTAKPEITSQAKGRCPANQPCPISGYWFAPAKKDSRAYFKKGDIMPDYPHNNWGEVIWQFDGEKA